MPTETQRNPLDLLNPDMNGGRLGAVNLVPGLDFVFVYGSAGAGSTAPKVRLFGDPLLEAFKVEEISSSGSVPFLRATNDTTFDVVLIAGQLVKGGKQNRGINTDILVCSGKTAQIPVTCVEQGRWNGGAGSRFQHGGVEPINIRSEKFRGVSSSRRGSGEFCADQGGVWNNIAQMSRSLQAPSDSKDLLASLEQIKSRRSRGHAAEERLAGLSGTDLDAELERLEHRLREAQHQSHRLLEMLQSMVGHRDFDAITEHRRHLDRALRELGVIQGEIERVRHLRASRGNSSGVTVVTDQQLQKADDAAKGALGMLAFFNGEFLAGDLFANSEWFAKFYGDLRDSALMTWDMVAMRSAETGRQMDPQSGTKAQMMARSVVNDALRGAWADRPAAAHGRAQMLEHPYLEGALLSDDGGAPLHVLVGSKHTPEILRA